jgi:hypothetical protein
MIRLRLKERQPLRVLAEEMEDASLDRLRRLAPAPIEDRNCRSNSSSGGCVVVILILSHKSVSTSSR